MRGCLSYRSRPPAPIMRAHHPHGACPCARAASADQHRGSAVMRVPSGATKGVSVRTQVLTAQQQGIECGV
jgi:hypothetical protein